MYLVMVTPLLLGSVLHAVAWILVGAQIESRAKRSLAALALSPVVPGFVVIMSLPGAVPLSTLLVSSGIATLVFGTFAAIMLPSCVESARRKAQSDAALRPDG